MNSDILTERKTQILTKGTDSHSIECDKASVSASQ